MIWHRPLTKCARTCPPETREREEDRKERSKEHVAPGSTVLRCDVIDNRIHPKPGQILVDVKKPEVKRNVASNKYSDVRRGGGRCRVRERRAEEGDCRQSETVLNVRAVFDVGMLSKCSLPPTDALWVKMVQSIIRKRKENAQSEGKRKQPKQNRIKGWGVDHSRKQAGSKKDAQQ